ENLAFPWRQNVTGEESMDGAVDRSDPQFEFQIFGHTPPRGRQGNPLNFCDRVEIVRTAPTNFRRSALHPFLTTPAMSERRTRERWPPGIVLRPLTGPESTGSPEHRTSIPAQSFVFAFPAWARLQTPCRVSASCHSKARAGGYSSLPKARAMESLLAAICTR